MEWFRDHHQDPGACLISRDAAAGPLPNNCRSAQSLLESLPSTEGIVIGHLTSLKSKTKDGLITLDREVRDADGYDSDVFLHRTLVSACEATVGDRLAFTIHQNDRGQLQASAPIWKRVNSHPPSNPKETDSSFPEFVGVVESITPSGDCGYVHSPIAHEVYGKSVYVQRVLLGGRTAVRDIVAFNIRVNSKGNPQAVAPLFKMFAQHPPSCQTQRAARQRPQPVPQPLPKVPADCAMTDWAAFPQELLPRTLAAAGPAELCRLAFVCNGWSDALAQAEAELDGFWRALCIELYPTMAAKLLAAEHEGTDGMPCPETEMHPGAEAELDGSLQFCPPARASILDGTTRFFWKGKFLHRHSRQLASKSAKQEQQRLRQQRAELHRQQISAEDKQRGHNFRGQDNSSLRSVRTRTCRRCGVRFLPRAVDAGDACWWHRGQYVRLDDDGVLEANGPQISRTAVQRAIRASGQKKKSKQPNLVVPVDENGWRSQERWAWSCCGARSMVAAGCCNGPHS